MIDGWSRYMTHGGLGLLLASVLHAASSVFLQRLVNTRACSYCWLSVQAETPLYVIDAPASPAIRSCTAWLCRQ